jgi:hypothetical protein
VNGSILALSLNLSGLRWVVWPRASKYWMGEVALSGLRFSVIKKRQRTRPIPVLSARERAGFLQSVTKTEDAHELWAVKGNTVWARWRTNSFRGAEFRTEDGTWWRAARVGRVLAGYPDDPHYVRPLCGVDRCVKADHQYVAPGGGPGMPVR